jgi:hypothetical protein
MFRVYYNAAPTSPIFESPRLLQKSVYDRGSAFDTKICLRPGVRAWHKKSVFDQNVRAQAQKSVYYQKVRAQARAGEPRRHEI